MFDNFDFNIVNSWIPDPVIYDLPEMVEKKQAISDLYSKEQLEYTKSLINSLLENGTCLHSYMNVDIVYVPTEMVLQFGGAMVGSSSEDRVCIFISDMIKVDELVGILAHEVSHLWEMVNWSKEELLNAMVPGSAKYDSFESYADCYIASLHVEYRDSLLAFLKRLVNEFNLSGNTHFQFRIKALEALF